MAERHRPTAEAALRSLGLPNTGDKLRAPDPRARMLVARGRWQSPCGHTVQSAGSAKALVSFIALFAGPLPFAPNL